MAGIYRLKAPGRKKPGAGSEEGNPDDHYDHRTGNDQRHDPAQRASRRGRLVRDMADRQGVTRYQATTAMVLAETVAAGIGDHIEAVAPHRGVGERAWPVRPRRRGQDQLLRG